MHAVAQYCRPSLTFGIVRRERLRLADLAGEEKWAERLMAFKSEWDAIAHRSHRSTKSAARVMARCPIKDVNPEASAATDFRSLSAEGATKDQSAPA
jgi:hypothetical protein